MQEILGKAKTIRELLGGAKFSIDYYQREYRWGKTQILELIEDLAEKFSESYKKGDEPSAVEQYGHYFLGSIIISDRDGKKFIIDGQQRLTSITLLLIYLYHQLKDDSQKAQLADLIFSTKFGTRSFNLDIKERKSCMNSLFKGESLPDNVNQPESVSNILRRFQNIEEKLSDSLASEEDGSSDEDIGHILPYFADWLIENVHFVEITAYSDSDAYTIFETMNDRGLSLTPTEMLKGYLLSNITDSDRRNEAGNIWRKRVEALKQLGKEEDANAIKAWLRSQHAESIRERKRGAQPRDFDLIGTEFHRWVHDHKEELGLTKSAEFGRFIEKDFGFYSRQYESIREAAETFTDGLEAIYYNAQNKFTLQYPVLLAPLERSDNDEKIRRKLRIVANYLDIMIARRIWNFKATGYSTMQYTMFQLVLKIRRKTIAELVDILIKQLNAEEHTFASNNRFRLHNMNGPQIHRLLARMTDYIETRSGRPSRYDEYIQRSGTEAYEVEHIWANHPERHESEFEHPNDFSEYRNRIGGLLLLPKSFNASFGDKAYDEKMEPYFGQNLLARSLNEKAYENDPGFKRFIQESKLNFKAHPEFKRANLDARQELYLQIAEQIWNPEKLRQEADT